MTPTWRKHVPQLELYRSKIALSDDGASPIPSLRLRPYDEVRMRDVKVVLMGWNPYRERKHATGFAFEMNEGYRRSIELVGLHNMLVDDLGYKMPIRNSLRPWIEQGVLLINRNIQTYISRKGKPYDNDESHTIQHRTLRHLDTPYRAFVFFGVSPCKLAVCVDKGLVIKLPYLRDTNLAELKQVKLFSTINAHLEKHGVTPINWRLP